MSTINRALAKLSNQTTQQGVEITRAEVKPVKSRSVVAWVVGSFAASLAVGGWAISQQSPSEAVYPAQVDATFETSVSMSPTSKPSTATEVFVAPSTSVTPKRTASTKLASSTSAESESKAASQPSSQPKQVSSNVNARSSSSVQSAQPVSDVVQGELVVEQVSLTAEQLAKKAATRGKKALDNNNLKQALEAYHQALRYTPNDGGIRQRLAALYYGKGEVRKAAALLQKGIALNSEDVDLRLALAKMLLKEQQAPAALTVLSAMPEQASIEYLSLRAALAQKQKQDEIALNSYQQLVRLEPDSGRWWLGLAIQQERAFELVQAKASYGEALTKLGLSSQSQQFIRDRLALIRRLEEQPQ
ncbi:tetratricopeptide repeat protein [Vibrio sp. JPW-9-11-11]|uniref:tetratricopeptide repeat protein n=1 Tax=Vibrio sp. JPW-9-11-11 TaxID=1416532 RepID=UPI001594D450|nr:tetratricopeptide repeat protein [Vibrio sp. JPW-9-11-11]NVD07588.1 tetratricopeptide repeat protein [Vibrio sp. JPW-9-11-11]